MEEGAPFVTHAFFHLMSAIDKALVDACHWPTVIGDLSLLFPLRREEAPASFPSVEEVGKLRQLAAVAAWSRADAELFSAVCSHLEAAATVRLELTASRIRWEAALHALDHVGRGVLLVNRDSRVLMTNTIASDVLHQRDGLYMQEGQLMTTRASRNIELRQAIEAVATQASPSATLAIPRPSLRQLLTLLLTPAADGEVGGLRNGRDQVLVFINDPERRLHAQPETLSRMYGLTRAEAALACYLLEGKTLEEAARALEITANTARTHLKRIFLKTDTNRQSQLVLLLMGSAGATASTAERPVAAAPDAAPRPVSSTDQISPAALSRSHNN